MNNTIRKIIFWILVLIITILAVTQVFLYCSILFSFIAPALTVPIALLVVVTICIKNGNNHSNYIEESNNIKMKAVYDYRNIYINTITKEFEKKYDVSLNVPMSDIIKMNNDFPKAYRKTLNEIIDIVLYDKITSAPTLLIRIDNNKKENIKLSTICSIANINLIKFWSNINNSDKFIIDKINDTLRDSN